MRQLTETTPASSSSYLPAFVSLTGECAANMMIICVSCNKQFRSQDSFNQHSRSQSHALRRLAGQLEADRKLACQSTEIHRPIQARPTCHQAGVPQTHLVSTQQCCIPCNRTFKDATALFQHLQNSKSHITASLPPPQAQNIQIHTISRQTSVSTPYERQTSLVDVNDSRARTSQTLNHLRPISSEQFNH
jgi:hypothetical protein